MKKIVRAVLYSVPVNFKSFWRPKIAALAMFVLCDYQFSSTLLTSQSVLGRTGPETLANTKVSTKV